MKNINCEVYGSTNIDPEEIFIMTVSDSLYISGRGLVVVGHISKGNIKVGETVKINGQLSKVSSIEMFRKELKEAKTGMTVGLLLSEDIGKIPSGTLITK